MTAEPRDTRPKLERTPALEQLLRRLHGRVVRQVWLHGLGTLAGVGALWVLFAFLADWGLHVPLAVRLAHSAILLGLPLFAIWRFLLRPLGRVPDRAGMALLVERAHPELRELLVSAAQLQQSPNGDPALISRILAEADRRAASLDLTGVLVEGPQRLRFGLGAAIAALVAFLGLTNPELSAIFLTRALGGSRPWPQATHLSVEIPLHGDRAQIDASPERIEVRVARGTDVPILITAEGQVPDEVELHFDDGETVLLSAGGGQHFRQVLHSCQQDLSFHVTGGDDLDGLPLVSVTVLQPPVLVALAVRVTPPAYSGLASEVIYDRDVEVLGGSRIEVFARAEPADASGQARLLPRDELFELQTAPWPDLAAAEGPPSSSLSFAFTANASAHYRFELVDSTGLANPDPGLFAVRVVEDRPPDLSVLAPAPAHSDLQTIRGGALPLRLLAEDDFGLVSATWKARLDGIEDGPGVGAALELQPLAGDLAATAEGPGTPWGPARDALLRRGLGRARIEVAALAPPGTAVEEGQQYLLEFAALDNCMPEPHESTSAAIRVRVVTADDLLHRVQERLARARLTATALAQLQREKRGRVEDLLDASDGADGRLDEADALGLQTALFGQRRVEGDARALSRELASIAETVLYARIDEQAGGLLENIDGALAEISDRSFHPEPWQALTRAHAAGELGAPGFASHLVEILALCLAISEDLAAEATLALDRVQAEVQGEALSDGLARAVELQTASLERIEDLLERLAEWDNFQSVLTLTRDIINRQKDLQNRLKDFASDE